MSAADPFLRMALKNAWANETLYAQVARLSPGAFTAPRPGFFPALSQTLNHILLVDRFYLAALEGAPVGYDAIHAEDVEDAASCAALQRTEDLRLIAFCRGLTEADLAAIRKTNRDGRRVPERVDAILLHLFQHQIHHRGQAHVQLQDAGIAPPQLDDFHLEYGRVPGAQAWLDG